MKQVHHLLTVLLVFITMMSTAQNQEIHYPLQAITAEDSLCTAEGPGTRYKVSKEGNNTLYKYQPVINPLVRTTTTQPVSIRKEETKTAGTPVTPPAGIATLTIDTSRDVGQIPYETDIINGALTYTVPIQVVQAGKGLQPRMAITYNSLSGNGIAGFGWNLSGTSSIAVTAGNFYFDGENAQPEKIENNSILMLDGMRLIKTSETTTQIVYETEIGNITVISYFPSKKYYLDVHYPEGKTGRFGYTTDTAPQPVYPLTRMTDKFSNYIDYTYTRKDNNFYPSVIQYGSRGKQLGYIQFNYTSRQYNHTSYIAGTPIRLSNLLSSIETYAGTNRLLATYTLKHSLNTFNILTAIHCTSGTKELNPLQFTYGTNARSGTFQKELNKILSTYFANNKAADLILSKAGFFANSSIDGMIAYPNFQAYGITATQGSNNQYGSRYSPAQNLLLYRNLSGGLCTPNILEAGTGFQKLVAVDIDGDGNDEPVKVNYYLESGKGKVVYTTYNASMTPTSVSLLLNGTFKEGSLESVLPRAFVFGDFTDNGKAEMLTLNGNKTPKDVTYSGGTRATLVNLESRTTISDVSIRDIDILKETVFAADMNGNGKTDLCIITATGMFIYSYINNTFVQTGSNGTLTTGFIKNKQLLLGDINNDGKMDILLSPARDRYTNQTQHIGICQGVCGNSTAIDNGDTWIYERNGSRCEVYKETYRKYMDDAYDWHICLGTGAGMDISRHKLSSPYDTGYAFLLQDVDGNGTPDLVVNREGTLSFISNLYGTFAGGYNVGSIEVDKDAFFIAGNADVNSRFRNGQVLSIKASQVTPLVYTYNSGMERLLTKTINSNGITTTYTYESFPESGKTTATNYTYPYQRVNNSFYLVNATQTQLDNITIDSRTYTYYDAVINRHRNNFCGFRQIECRDNLRNQTHTFRYDPTRFGVETLAQLPTQKTESEYTISVAANKKARITLATQKESNLLTGHLVTTSYTYDSYGNALTQTAIDSDNRIQKSTRTYSNSTAATNYIIGTLLSRTDQITLPDQSTVQYTDTYQLHPTLNPPSVHIRKYDGKQVLKEENKYDEYGNLIEHKTWLYDSPTAQVTTCLYDDFDRITKQTAPEGTYTSTVYNQNGLPEKVTGQGNRTTLYEYNTWGEVVKTTHPDGTTGTLSASWDTTEGALYSITQTVTGRPVVKTWYDALGREVRNSEQRFDNKQVSTSRRYNNKGLLQSESQPYTGTTATLWTNYIYDDYDRILEIRAASGNSQTYAYNKAAVTTRQDGVEKNNPIQRFGTGSLRTGYGRHYYLYIPPRRATAGSYRTGRIYHPDRV
ncbi:MAG: FG-GAP-like repeat-containing protein [Tannerellaceae bacterium]|nr:FG-GAP-like repeat-containing protein [Tannerellaceae bacterium]